MTTHSRKIASRPQSKHGTKRTLTRHRTRAACRAERLRQVLPEVACWLRLRAWCLALKAVVTGGAARALRQVLARLAQKQFLRPVSAVAGLPSDRTGLRLWN